MGFYDRMKEARLRQRQVGEKPTYKVLQSDQINPAEKKRVASIASFVRTGDEAYKLAGHDGFAYSGLDMRGRCGVVKYRGKEVALLFKREIVEVEPGPADPVPERTLIEPAEAWIQIDLLGLDTGTQQSSVSDRLRSALGSIENLKLLWNNEKRDRQKVEEKLVTYEQERVELQTLKSKVERYEKTITEQILEVEGLKRQLNDEKRERKSEHIKLVEALFPVFNTVWLAGLHRVEDKLYSMLQKMLEDGLGKIGITLIEPELGEEFNPQIHNAVHGVPYPVGAKEINTVVQVNQVGWKLNSQVVAVAEVYVGVEKEEEPQPASAQEEGKKESTEPNGSVATA